MAKRHERLTARAVETLKTPGYYPDGLGLYLQIGKAGGKSWLYRYTRGTRLSGKGEEVARQREMGLGRYPAVPLAGSKVLVLGDDGKPVEVLKRGARELADAARSLLADGVDPIDHRREQEAQRAQPKRKTMTFKASSEQFIKAHAAKWVPKHTALWHASLAEYVYPAFGDRDVATITKRDVLDVIEPLWQTKYATANILLKRIELVLSDAVAREHRPDGPNPAAYAQHKTLLPRLKRKQAVKPRAALPADSMAAFMVKLRATEGAAAKALEFSVLTAARSGEVLGATWAEFDLQRALWVVPAARMKARIEHRQPLSKQAVRLLQSLPREAGTDLVFPGSTGVVMQDYKVSKLCKELTDGAAVPHGFRSTFRDWAGELTSHPHDAVEQALAHVVGNATELSYRRGDLMAKRKVLLQDWADFCDRPAVPATITNIATKRGTKRKA